MGESQAAPRFRLIGSQTLRQQLFKYANIYGPVGPQVKVPVATRAPRGIPWAAAVKIRTLDNGPSSIPGDSSDL